MVAPRAVAGFHQIAMPVTEAFFPPSKSSSRRRRLAISLQDVVAPSVQPICESDSLSPTDENKADFSAIFQEPTPGDPARSVNRLQEILQSPSRLTWMFAGDSLTAANKSPARGGSHVSYLVRMIRDRIGRAGDIFISAETPEFQLKSMAEHVLELVERFQPHFLLLTFGNRQLEETDETPLEFERMFHNVINQLNAKGVTVIVNLPPFHEAAMDADIPDRLIRLEALRACAMESSTLLVDHWSHWEQRATPEWYRSNRIHPSEQGAIEIARRVVRELGLDPAASTETKSLAPVNSVSAHTS